MIEPVWIRVVTVAVLFVGFGLGYWYRGWADTQKADKLWRRVRRRRGKRGD